MIVSGSELSDNKFNNDLVSKYNNIFMSAGFHPCMANSFKDEDLVFLENIINSNRKVVAVGEIGLDYYYGSDNKEKQIIFFKEEGEKMLSCLPQKEKRELNKQNVTEKTTNKTVSERTRWTWKLPSIAATRLHREQPRGKGTAGTGAGEAG